MGIEEQVKQFSNHCRKGLVVNHLTWRHYSLGGGAPILGLTGGLRRAALGFAFMEGPAARHTGRLTMRSACNHARRSG